MSTEDYPMLVLNEIVQEYPDPNGGDKPNRVVDKLSLAYDKPSINMLLGPSGCGKSTVLKMMGGVRPIGVTCPTSGEVYIDGKPCPGEHEDAVMVFQRYANFPDRSIRDNVGISFKFKLWKERVPEKEREERIDQILEAVGLQDKANLRPSQLSGGQNQRVALARALVLRPRILLMDEPFGALDAQTREDMQDLLCKLHESHPCLVVFVTHDVTEALAVGDRITVLSTQPATVADDFVLDNPRPRTEWLKSPEAAQLEQRILEKLHSVSAGKGHLRVSV